MSNRLHQLILALAITGIAGGVLAQSAPDAGPGGAGPGGPHAMDKDGDWGEGRYGHHHHHCGHRRGPGMMGGMGLIRSFHELNLSAAQQRQVHGIVADARQQFAAERASGVPDMAALINPGDANYAAAVQAAKKRAADRIQRFSDLKLQLYNVLTSEQKTQLSKSVANWKARMAHRAQGPRGRPAPVDR